MDMFHDEVIAKTRKPRSGDPVAGLPCGRGIGRRECHDRLQPGIGEAGFVPACLLMPRIDAYIQDNQEILFYIGIRLSKDGASGRSWPPVMRRGSPSAWPNTIMAKRYLSLCSLDHALGVMKSSFPAPQRTEQVPIMESVGRVVAVPVYAPVFRTRSAPVCHGRDRGPEQGHGRGIRN